MFLENFEKSKKKTKEFLSTKFYNFFFSSESLVLSYVIVRTNLLKTEHNKPTQ